MITQQHVDEAMQCAVAQGYSFKGRSTADIALDLLAYDAEVEGVALETLEPFVADWRARNL
jgi:hypothetical protein